jgi:hypothetical protein
VFYAFYGQHNGKTMINLGSVGTCMLDCRVIDPVTKENALPATASVLIQVRTCLITSHVLLNSLVSELLLLTVLTVSTVDCGHPCA